MDSDLLPQEFVSSNKRLKQSKQGVNGPQTADRRLQTADCRPQIADCKLKDTKNLPNKGDTLKNITSCESEKVAWEQG